MRTAIPRAKLIYVVRDPIERVLAEYVQEYAQERESRPFEAAVGDVEDPYNRYVAAGLYASQLRRYLEAFDPERVLVVDGHRLLSDRARALREIFEFLDVDPDFTSADFDEVLNTRDSKIRWSRTGRWLERSPAGAAARRWLPPGARTAIVAPVKRLVTTRLESPRLDPPLRARLTDAFRPDLDELRELTGLPLDGWPEC
jgi:hypothetical protein